MADAVTAERLESLRIDRARTGDRRRWRRWLLLGGLGLLAVLAALMFFRRPAQVAVAQVREARVGEAQTVLTSAGYVASRRRSVVAPKVPGKLDRLLVEEGERVKEGALIAQLDARDAKVALDGARAEVRAAQAALVAARATEAQAARELERTEALFKGAATSRQAYDQARYAADSAVAQTASARARLTVARESVSAAELAVENTSVRAPFTGTVVRKLADEGAVLAPAAISTENVGGIVELVDLSQLEVEAEVGEDSLAQVEIGQPVLVQLDAYPDRLLRGRVESLRPVIERAKATGVVKVSFTDDTEGVLPDMAARVSFLREELSDDALDANDRLRVAASAVVERDGAPVVFVVDGGRVDAVPVKPGKRVDEEVVLLEGPKPGTQVVAAPGERLRAGDRVTVEATGP